MKISKILTVIALSLMGLFYLTSCYDEAKAVDTAKTATARTALEWHGIQDLANLQAKNPKKVIVDIYTDWCKWCKVMDQKTFADPAIAPYLADNYHLIKLNAEDKNSLTFNGKAYAFVQQGKRGYHQLAAELLKGSMSYPSFVVLDENMNISKVIKGFKNSQQFKAELEN